MAATHSLLFLRCGARVDPTVAAVEADAASSGVHPLVVNVVEAVHVIHRRVVEKMTVLPGSTFITMTEVSETIVDPAIETYGRAPVTLIENKSSAAPTPNSRASEGTLVGEPPPMSRVPVIGGVRSPIPRRPDITVARANRLIVSAQRRGRDP